MLFYHFSAKWLDPIPRDRWEDEHEALCNELHSATDRFNQRHKETVCLLSALRPLRSGYTLSGAVAMLDEADVPAVCARYLECLGLRYEELLVEETVSGGFERALSVADRNDLIACRDQPYRQLDTSRRRDPTGFSFQERLLGKKRTKAALAREAEDCLWSQSLLPELERIYTKPKNQQVRAHPVHYFLKSGPGVKSALAAQLLMQALYANGRVRGERYLTVRYEPAEYCGFEHSAFAALCRQAKYCAVLLDLTPPPGSDSEFATPGDRDLRHIARAIRDNQRDVQFVIMARREPEKVRQALYDLLPGMTFVEMQEDVIFQSDAKAYLRRLARRDHVKVNKALYGGLTDPERGYTGGELHKMFDRWFSTQLKEQVYPQYAGQAAVLEKTVKEKPRGSAYDELKAMIGLTEAKAVVEKALAFYKARKLYRDRGLGDSTPAMHMVFTGSPGTAKTSVARLFAQIMRDNGVLSHGDLVEVGRGDLVGKYVGWTAPTVQEKFKKAVGSVLFIDEAYSLVDDREGMFGDEAINTIVQEMENHRNDVIVIFAGYADKMEGFLSRNPGLRSRIAFHVPFADYSEGELMEIAHLMAQRAGFRLADDVADTLLPLFTQAKRDPEYGNGRFVRNLLEQARMNQAMRIVRGDVEHMGDEEIRTLTAEDFRDLSLKVSQDRASRPIGFRL